MEICISARGLIHNSAESFSRELKLMFQFWLRLKRDPGAQSRVPGRGGEAAGRSVSAAAAWDVTQGSGGGLHSRTGAAFQVDS